MTYVTYNTVLRTTSKQTISYTTRLSLRVSLTKHVDILVINQQRPLQALLTNYRRQLTYIRPVAYKSHKHFIPAYKTLRILNPKSTLRTANITAGPSL